MKNPYKIWLKCNVAQKQLLFYYLFEGDLEYEPEVGFRTPKKGIFIRLFEQFCGTDSDYVKTDGKTSNPIYIELLNLSIDMRALLKDID
jgi:hypothetical protein